MSIKNVIFDLDGTVIDSADGINKAFGEAYTKLYGVSCTIDMKSFVGPPIKDIFVELSSEKDPDKISLFVKYFQEEYDSTFYTECSIYNGIPELFQFLREQKINCYIATNKRLGPTTGILKHLDIAFNFKNIYAIDSVPNSYRDKAHMIKDLLEIENLSTSETILIGDTLHDQIAAEKNNLIFIYADYGYGKIDNTEMKLTKYLQLNNYINLIA